MKLAELGEFGLIDNIAARVPSHPSVRLGIGDDAAALLPSPGCLTLITSDMLLEGVHFDLSFGDPQSLGRKSLAVNLSDLAAMGAQPRQFLLNLALPSGTSVEFVEGFVSGVLEMAQRHGAILVGGDTCASRGGVAISITALGEQRPEKVLKRSGARPGDAIFVTGTVGDAAAGLELLFRGVREGVLVAKQLDPAPRVAAGVALAEEGLAHSMIDVSDGVLADLGHICDLSRVAAQLELAALPLCGEYLAHCQGDDPFALALSGGEDYELLFSAPHDKESEIMQLMERHGVPVARIGEIREGSGIDVVSPDGSSYLPKARGFNHFA